MKEVTILFGKFLYFQIKEVTIPSGKFLNSRISSYKTNW